MALIKCPECGNRISDKAESCPYCGCPRQYFFDSPKPSSFDYGQLKNALIMFSSEWRSLFSSSRYIPKSAANKFFKAYEKYAEMLKNPLVQRYIQNNSKMVGFDYGQAQKFINCLESTINL